MNTLSNTKRLAPLAIAMFSSFAPNVSTAETQTMIVAGGCFWCVESDFEKVDGVLDVVSGYTGGHQNNPTYRQVAAKKRGILKLLELPSTTKSFH